MAKIKVNELEKMTPSDGDTLLASGAEKEYALKVEDLKDYIGGGEADWNASEGEEGYIKNRTHYTETVEDNIEWTFNLPGSHGEQYNDSGNSEIKNKIYEVYLADKDDAEKMTLFLNKPIYINETEYNCYFFYRKEGEEGSVYLTSISDTSLIVKDVSKYTYLSFTKRVNNSDLSYFTSWFNVGVNTIKIPYMTENVVKLDPKYLPEIDIPEGLKNIKDTENGGIIEGFIDGQSSQSNTASGQYAHAEGLNTHASGEKAHAEGWGTTASGRSSHVEGSDSSAYGDFAHAEGMESEAYGVSSHAEGDDTSTSGQGSHSEGGQTTALGMYSHAEGWGTTSNHKSQHVFGRFNITDPNTAQATDFGTYVEIVGNGSAFNNLSNARTLDWNGNEWLAGTISPDGGVILKSPNGTAFKLTVSDDGTLSATNGDA